MGTIRTLLVRLVVLAGVAGAAFWATWWGATQLHQTPRQAEAWAWIAVVLVVLLSGAGGDVWALRFAGMRERMYAGRLAGWDGRPEPGRRRP